ncbi:hypothetical protein [Methylocaldum sp.]|uniref:anti-sigma factor family protein n=1 Tax=Methylocaldum sp. TaxID=1969727 RepID=UPI002D450FF4|nr:hypothetical protein [Methylocaldum sp.]HYE37357.1 hypothetical protein [Methylocaldum sp.]
MLSCKEASALESKSLDAPLTQRERFGLWLHLRFCRLCRRYVRDLHFLRHAFRRARENGGLADHAGLSEAARERIRRVLSGEEVQ